MKYGWKKDSNDERDHHYRLGHGVDELTQVLPPDVDLRGATMPPVYDQGDLGSCTANALCGAFQFGLRKQKLPDFVPSRLFVYYNERKIEGDTGEDNGAELRDGIKTLASSGVVSEKEWKYIPERFAEQPPVAAYHDALSNLALQYERLNGANISEIKACLAAGHPFVFGFSVYSSFQSQEVAKTGTVNVPTHSEQLLGGHAVMGVGYDENSSRVICRNSWGPDWGMKGYFTMPYAYITNPSLTSDFWTIRLVK